MDSQKNIWIGIGFGIGVIALLIGGIYTLTIAFCWDSLPRAILFSALFGIGFAICFAGILLFFFADGKIGEIPVVGCLPVILLVVVCLGAVIFFGRMRSQNRCPTGAEIYSALSKVCNGVGSVQAGNYNPAPGYINHVVLLDMSIKELKNPSITSLIWAPDSLAHTELVLCIGKPQTALVETCQYSDGSDVNRYKNVLTATLASAATGNVVAAQTFVWQPDACAQTEPKSVTKLVGEVKISDVTDWADTWLRNRPPAAQIGITPTLSTSLMTPTAAGSPPIPVTPSVTPFPLVLSTQEPTVRPTATLRPVAVPKTSYPRVRSGPGEQFPTVASLYPNEQVDVLGVNETREWVKVLLFGADEGWILANLVNLSVPIESLPVVK